MAQTVHTITAVSRMNRAFSFFFVFLCIMCFLSVLLEFGCCYSGIDCLKRLLPVMIL